MLFVRLQTKYDLSDCLDTYDIYKFKEKAEEYGQVFRTPLQALQTEWIVIYDSLEQSVARFGEVLNAGKASDSNAKEVQCSYLSLSLHLHLSRQWPYHVGSCDISFDFTNVCTNSPHCIIRKCKNNLRLSVYLDAIDRSPYVPLETASHISLLASVSVVVPSSAYYW